ncbi:TdcA1-ORF2 protein [Corchorus capsularis]|uniref:TdcA1-ORF2 protein n=1 Tax=Corchorus capsularis TaxID=210143 RepID=A0A1R3IPE7_COCAP|nr:TdcA1-ORF2 protein [Corchorus capsularis]
MSFLKSFLKVIPEVVPEHYFESDVRCTSRRPRRNDEVVNDPSLPPFSIFNYPGRFYGRPRARSLRGNESKVAYTYILRNCPEVETYFEMFVNYLKGEGHTPESIDLAIDTHFAEWFRLFVLTEENGVTNQILRTLAWGPTEKATSWPAYLVNGYKFHTVAHGRGNLCDWFDPQTGMQVHPLYKLDNFQAALRAAEAQAGDDPTALAAIDKNALFAEHARGSKGR